MDKETQGSVAQAKSALLQRIICNKGKYKNNFPLTYVN